MHLFNTSPMRKAFGATFKQLKKDDPAIELTEGYGKRLEAEFQKMVKVFSDPKWLLAKYADHLEAEVARLKNGSGDGKPGPAGD